LTRQFEKPEEILEAIRRVALRGDFTLGKEVKEFEEKFAQLAGTKYAVGVNSGTDALVFCLKALGVGAGDEVITVPNTFYATAAAIALVGARPVFVDVNEEYLMDAKKLERVITPRTKAIIPVQLTGNVCDMEEIMAFARNHNLVVVEDACQSITASLWGKPAGSFGQANAFSLHPLKNLNVWGDGGLITTDSEELYQKFLKLRNHGLISRDICEFYGHNSRLHTVQAAVGLEVLKTLPEAERRRRELAAFYDRAFADIPQLKIPPRPSRKQQVFHLYILLAERRDELIKWLASRGVEAKIHYPIPLHLQPASRYLGYKEADFPVAEFQAQSIVSLPLHQHLIQEEAEKVVSEVKNFYVRSSWA